MYSRRDFLGAVGIPAVAAAVTLSAKGSAHARESLRFVKSTDPKELARDEDFWFEVAQAFSVDRSIVNLNNGGVSPSPRIVQQAMTRHLAYSNTAPPYTMWRVRTGASWASTPSPTTKSRSCATTKSAYSTR